MADDISTLAAQLVELKRAYRSGLLRASCGDYSVEYRSAEEMRAAIANLEAEIAKLQATLPIRTVMVRSAKGW
jgi:hypothetical protein